MAEQIVSPGVFTRENDQSFIQRGIEAIGAAVVGPTAKGPIFIPTMVTSISEYENVFGTTVVSGSDYYQYLTNHAAREYFRNGGESLLVVRISSGSYAYATSTIQTPLNVESGSFNDVSGAITSAGLSDVGNPSTGSSLSASVAAGTVKKVAIPISSLALGSGESVYSASAALFTLADSGNTGYTLVSSGVYNTVTSNFINYFVTSSTLANGTELFDGTYKKGIIRDVATFETLTPGAVMNNTGSEISGSLVSGSTENVRLEISTVNSSTGTFTLLVRRGDDTSKSKVILETFTNLSLDPNSANYILNALGDIGYDNQNPYYDAVSGNYYIKETGAYTRKSNYIRVKDVKLKTPNYLNSLGSVSSNIFTHYLPAASSSSFSGGSDGDKIKNPIAFNESISSTNFQGFTPGTDAYTKAISLLSNQDEYDFNLIMIPGINAKDHSSILQTVVDMAESRGDCFVLADATGYSNNLGDVQDAVSGFDTSYAGVYWPWVKIRDTRLGKNVWVPPSTVMGGVYAFNDSISAEWFAPAGLNRGGIPSVIQAERKLSHAERDNLYENRVNPLATFPGEGVVAFGQKTLQKRASALDRINVRRLLIALKKFIASSSRYLVFEQNTVDTRNRFLSIVNPYLESVQQRQGLYAFRVVMDESNNTSDVIDRNLLVGQIYIQPTKTAEFIVLDFNILPTGATFEG